MVLNTQGRAGFVFDYYGPSDYKFVAIDAVTDQVLVGHRTARDGWAIDSVAPRDIVAGSNYTLSLSVRNSVATVSVNGSVAFSHAFNGVPVDGRFGLFTKGAASTFDDFSIRTNDPAFLTTAEPAALTATGTPDARGADSTASVAQIQPLFEEALRRWSATADTATLDAMRAVDIQVVDLAGDELGAYADGVVFIDINAAGHGWYLDETPQDDREFLVPGQGPAAGQMDLLSVVAHELGHAAGLDHADTGVMDDLLAAGTRTLLAPDAVVTTPRVPAPQAREALADAPAPMLVWDAPLVAPVTVVHSAPAAAPAWMDDFLNHLGKSEQERNPNASLRISVAPVVMKPATELKPALGAFPREGGRV